MRLLRSALPLLVAATVAGVGCTQQAADRATQATDKAFDAGKSAAAAAIDKTHDASAAVADKAKEAAGKTAEAAAAVGDKTKAAADGAVDVIADPMITAKIKAKFADDKTLNGSTMDVDTKSNVVTLKGVVLTLAAKQQAEAIASGTKGVSRVINELIVK